MRIPSISVPSSPVHEIVRESGNDVAFDDVVVEGRQPIPGGAGVVEPGELGREGVRLMGGPDVGAVGRDGAGGRGHGVADEGIVAPRLRRVGRRGEAGRTRSRSRRCVRTRGNRRRTTRRVRPSAGRATDRWWCGRRGRSRRCCRRVGRGRSRSPRRRSRGWRLARARGSPSARWARRAVSAVRAARSRRATTDWYQPEPEWSSDTSATTVASPSQSNSHTLRSSGPTSSARLVARSTRNRRRRASPGRLVVGSGGGVAPLTARALQSSP